MWTGPITIPARVRAANFGPRPCYLTAMKLKLRLLANLNFDYLTDAQAYLRAQGWTERNGLWSHPERPGIARDIRKIAGYGYAIAETQPAA